MVPGRASTPCEPQRRKERLARRARPTRPEDKRKTARLLVVPAMDHDIGVVLRKRCDFFSGAPAGRARPPGGPCERMAYDGPPGGRPLPASPAMQKTRFSPENPCPPPGGWPSPAAAARGNTRHPFMPVVRLSMAGTINRSTFSVAVQAFSSHKVARKRDPPAVEMGGAATVWRHDVPESATRRSTPPRICAPCVFLASKIISNGRKTPVPPCRSAMDCVKGRHE